MNDINRAHGWSKSLKGLNETEDHLDFCKMVADLQQLKVHMMKIQYLKYNSSWSSWFYPVTSYTPPRHQLDIVLSLCPVYISIWKLSEFYAVTYEITWRASLEKSNYTSVRCSLQQLWFPSLALLIPPMYFRLRFPKFVKFISENNNHHGNIENNNHSNNIRTHKSQQIPGYQNGCKEIYKEVTKN